MRGGEPSAAEIRRRARRTGWITVALLIATAAGAVVLARRYHQDITAVLISAIVGLPGLYVAGKAYFDDRRAEAYAASAALSAEGLANRLAAAQANLWTNETGRSQLNTPYPLRVRWVSADPKLFDDWANLVTVAENGAGWPAPPSAHMWASGPGDLDGEGNQLSAVLARVPTGRLVVLGDPGAGKTTLMIRFVLDRLKQRAPGGPVPVLVPVASWDPSSHELHKWLADRLSTDYPWLKAPAPPGTDETTCFGALLSRNLILPVLDGLDEIPDTVRVLAVDNINKAAMPGESLLVTSRCAAYREAVHEVKLHGAAGIELCPLDSKQAGDYLKSGADSPAAKARWDPVLASLAHPGPLTSALSNPLMLGLAQVIYNPRPVSPRVSHRIPRSYARSRTRQRSCVTFSAGSSAPPTGPAAASRSM